MCKPSQVRTLLPEYGKLLRLKSISSTGEETLAFLVLKNETSYMQEFALGTLLVLLPKYKKNTS